MPVFYYLSEDEVADAYLYLTFYPPYHWAVADPVKSALARDVPRDVPQKRSRNQNENRRAQVRSLGDASSVGVNR
jgi:hypothetical protein